MRCLSRLHRKNHQKQRGRPKDYLNMKKKSKPKDHFKKPITTPSTSDRSPRFHQKCPWKVSDSLMSDQTIDKKHRSKALLCQKKSGSEWEPPTPPMSAKNLFMNIHNIGFDPIWSTRKIRSMAKPSKKRILWARRESLDGREQRPFKPGQAETQVGSRCFEVWNS